MIAEDAINETKKETQDLRKTVGLELKGHLFDKAILNRLLDMAVDSPCEFKVEEIEVAQRDELHSRAMLRLYSNSEEDLESTLVLMRAFVKSSVPIAECTMTELQ
jgi:homocitrate synthase